MVPSDSYGYAGKILRVDLTNRQVTEETLEEATLRKYLGGTGIGAYCLYKEVAPGVEWSDPANCLILSVGPLNGVRMAGAGTFSVTTKGALTNGATSSQSSGFFGAYLKSCGFDGILIKGKAEKLTYLYIHDGYAELRDASHLKFKDTWETEGLIKQELGKTKRELSVFSIGPAGENLVRFACIVGDEGHVASKNGAGAVMGSKNLKAVVAARGRRQIAPRVKENLDPLIKGLLEKFKEDHHYREGTSETYGRAYSTGRLAVRNYVTSIFPERSKFVDGYQRAHFETKPKPCFACSAKHCHIMKVTDGPYTGYVGEEPDYGKWVACSSLIGQTDPGAAVVLANEIDRLGMDNNETGWIIAWLMECFERGLLTASDLDGEMKWGDAEAVRAMLRRIAFRQGFGDLLAEGIMRASREVGGEAADAAIYTLKGTTLRTHDLRAQWWEMFDTCVSNTGTMETHHAFKRAQLGLPATYDPFSPEEVSTLVAKTKGSMQFEDSLVVCRFTAASQFELLCKILNEVTGWDFTLEKAMETGRRVVNLLKVFNLRHGIGSELDAPSARLASTPTDGPAKGKSIMPFWKQMVRNYYEHMGWDGETGKPLPDTLKNLGLEYTIPHIYREK